MKLKLDENLGVRGRHVLVRAGHDVSTVVDQGLTSAPDPALLEVCAREGRGRVTLDLDFANPLRFPPDLHAGVAVLRLPARPGPTDLDVCVATLVRALAARTFHRELWIVERDRVREYDKNRS